MTDPDAPWAACSACRCKPCQCEATTPDSVERQACDDCGSFPSVIYEYTGRQCWTCKESKPVVPAHVQEHLRMYQNEVRDLLADKKVLEKSLSDAKEEAAFLRERIDELEGQVALEDMRRERDEWKAKAEQAWEDRDAWRDTADNVLHQAEHYEREYNQLWDHIDAFKSHLAKLERENSALQDAVEHLRRQLAIEVLHYSRGMDLDTAFHLHRHKAVVFGGQPYRYCDAHNIWETEQ